MKTTHQWGYPHKDIHDVEKWARIRNVADLCGTMGFSGDWSTKDELKQMCDEYGGPLTLNLLPYNRDRGYWNESYEQHILHENCNRVANIVPHDRILKIFLDCERFKPGPDATPEQLAEVKRLYIDAYNIVQVEFPGILIVWYADLDSPHQLDLAPKEGHSCHAYHLENGYHTLTNTLRSCNKVRGIGLPLTVWVSWTKTTTGDAFELCDPIIVWGAVGMCASTNPEHAPLDAIDDVCIWPHPADSRVLVNDPNMKCLAAFIQGMRKEPWTG